MTFKKTCSHAGIRTRVLWVKATYPNRLDYAGSSVERSAQNHDIVVIHSRGGAKSSRAGTRTRVSWVRATYPNQLDYAGFLVHTSPIGYHYLPFLLISFYLIAVIELTCLTPCPGGLIHLFLCCISICGDGDRGEVEMETEIEER